MATSIKRIGKDFLLKLLYDKQIPIKYYYHRIEYTLTIEKPPKNSIFLCSNLLLNDVELEKKMDLLFDYQGQRTTFSVEVIAVMDIHIEAHAPDFFYVDLDRSFSRVAAPQDLKIQLGFIGSLYSLPYPRVYISEEEEIDDAMLKMSSQDLKDLSLQLPRWVKEHFSGYKITMFNDTKPTSREEKVVAETGMILYLQAVNSGFPRTDPYPKKRIITEDLFCRCLEKFGAPRGDREMRSFLEEKNAAGILAEALVPIVFQEYLIGCLHVWIDNQEKLPFTYAMLEVLSQFAKVLSFSFKANGYFDSGKKVNGEPFRGRIIDISVSGFLFAFPLPATFFFLQLDSELAVKLMTPQRFIDASVRVVRKYQEHSMGYFGCSFLDMSPEDTSFLFEYIYGIPFDRTDISFLTGQV